MHKTRRRILLEPAAVVHGPFLLTSGGSFAGAATVLLQNKAKLPVASSSSNRGHLCMLFTSVLLCYTRLLMHLVQARFTRWAAAAAVAMDVYN